jgi:hypothetical protein
MLRGQWYRTPQMEVTEEYGAMAEQWSAGENRRNPETNQIQCNFFHRESDVKSPGIEQGASR